LAFGAECVAGNQVVSRLEGHPSMPHNESMKDPGSFGRIPFIVRHSDPKPPPCFQHTPCFELCNMFTFLSGFESHDTCPLRANRLIARDRRLLAPAGPVCLENDE